MDRNSYGFDFAEKTIREISEALESEEITSRELVLMYMDRIREYDKSGPKINSIIEINPDAIHIAEALDNERRLTGSRGPLHGIPVLIKDNINTKDKMHTSAGSLSLANSYAPYDAFLVRKLREAGAIILGKTNLTEFANFMTDNMPSGYSSRGGQVLNPYLPNKISPGGSSSGSGAAVACSFCAAAVGTETSGSILSPACQNSIVGIKPTLGLISRRGIAPIAHSQDTAGPMARTVEDAAVLLNGMVGVDEEDPATLSSADKLYFDYSEFLDAGGLRGARIGIPREYFYIELTEDEKYIMEEAIETIKKLGAEIVEDVKIPSVKELQSFEVLVYEFKSDLNAYLNSLGPSAPVHSLKEIIEFNKKNLHSALKYGQTILTRAEKTSGTLTEPQYLKEKLRDLRLSREEGIDRALDENKLDALLFPGTNGCDIAAKAGYPSIIVPGGYTKEGVPFGITFTGKAYSEATLIKLAYSYEQGTKKRISPRL